MINCTIIPIKFNETRESTLLFLLRRFSLKNLRRTESSWEMWCKRIVAGFSPVTAIAIAIVDVVLIVVVSSMSSPPPPGLSVWNRAVWEIGEHRAVTLSLLLSSLLPYSMPGCVTIHFPTGAIQRSRRSTFLSYRLSLLAASPRLWMSAYIQLHILLLPPLTLFYTISFFFATF